MRSAGRDCSLRQSRTWAIPAPALVQSGGANTVSYLYLGNNPGSSGSYILSGSGVVTAIAESVGGFGSGEFVQSGGTNNLSGSLYVATLPGRTGAYTLSGSGLLTSTAEYVGNSGQGLFLQTGGTNNLGANNLYLGYNAGANGSYILGNAAALSLTGTEYVGSSGTGTFTQSNGTNNLGGGSLYLGYNAGAGGTYNLSGLGMLMAACEYIGSSGTGAFNQTGGVNSFTYLAVGGPDSYNLAGGTLQVAGGGILCQGVLNAAGSGLLTAADSIVDFSTATLQNTGGLSVNMGPDAPAVAAGRFLDDRLRQLFRRRHGT